MRLSIRNNSNFFIQFLLIFLIFFLPLAFGAVEVWATTVMQLAVLFMAACWFLKMLNQRQLCFFTTPLNLPIFIFIVFCLLQYAGLSIYKHATKIELFKLLCYAAAFFIVVNNIKTRKRINRIITSIIISGFIIAILGLVAKYGQTGKIYWLKDSSGMGGSLGLYVNRNNFAGFMIMIIPLTLGMLLADGKRAKGALYGFMGIIMVISLFSSQSRTGIIGFLVSLIFMSLMLAARKHLYKKALIILTCAVLAVFFLSFIFIAMTIGGERLLTLLNPIRAMAESRWTLWKDTFRIIRAFPFFGTGLGTFQHAFTQYKTIKVPTFFFYAENEYLQLLSETGLVGFLLFLWGVLAFAGRIAYRLFWPFSPEKRRDPYVIALGIGTLGSILALSIHIFTQFDLHIPSNAFLISIIAGLAITIAHNKFHEGSEDSTLPKKVRHIPRKISQVGYFAIAGLLILFSVPVSKIYLADRYAETGRLEKAAGLQPNCSRYHYLLGREYEEMDRQNNALDEYKRAIELEPINGLYHLRIGLIEKDEIYLKKAISLDPTNAYYHYKLAQYYGIYANAKNIPLALKQYSKTIELSPDTADKLLEEIAINISTDVDILRQYLPETARASYALADLLFKNGRYQEVLAETKRAISLAESQGDIAVKAIALSLQGHVAVKEGDLAEALALFKNAADVNPKDARHFYNIGYVYFQQDNFKETEPALKKAISVNPEHAPSYMLLGWLYEKQGFLNKASQQYKKILRLPENVASESTRSDALRFLKKVEGKLSKQE